MKTRLYLFFLILLCLNLRITNAASIGLEQAKEKAKQFYGNKNNINNGKNKAKSNAELKLLFTERKNNEALFYVFSKGETGFVIVSAEDGLSESILGYSYNGRFCPDSIPADARYWLDTYGEQINLIRNNKVASTKRNNTQKENIAPLTTSTWNQRSPYNDMCPTYNGVDHCLTGCVPVAFAQLMYYYKWPVRGNGRYTLETTVEGENVTITEDFSKTYYQWDIIQDSYYGASSRASKAAVATLMYHMGIIGRAKWGSVSTYAYYNFSADGLHQYFSYKKHRYLKKDSFTNEAWEDSIYNELHLKRPVIFSADPKDKESGHCFICDGYEDGYFHMNWGWGGYCDGYFLLTALNADPSNLDKYGYNYNQYIYLGIEPDHNAFSFSLSDDGVLTINGNGMMPNDFKLDSATWKDDCTLIRKIVIGEGITSIVRSFGYGLSNLEELVLPESLLSIEDYAFYGCNSLAAVTIPSSVTSIGENAFSNCSGLTKIIIEGENTIYDSRSGCNAIIETATNTLIAGCQNTIIPNSVTSIGYSAFSGCSGLTSITIGNNITSIGNYAFSNCNNLTSVILNSNTIVSASRTSSSSMKNIFGNQVKEYVIGDSVSTIGNSAFEGCTGLTSVTIPNSVTSIGYSAFSGCSGLTSITIGNNIASIGNYAFSYCNNLTSVILNSNTIVSASRTSSSSMKNIFGYQVKEYVIGDSVSTIGNSAFEGCTGLTSVTIGNNVTSIGENAFYNCSGLISVIIPESMTNIGDNAFTGTPWYNNWFENQPDGLVYMERIAYKYKGKMPDGTQITIKEGTLGIADYAFKYCSGLISVTIPNSVTSIGEYAFFNCSGLKSVTIGSGVTSIGQFTFYGCNSLESVMIGSGVTSIGQYAFYNCKSLTSVTIPNSVTSIGESAFGRCSGLKSITIGSGVTSIGHTAFLGCSRLTSVTIPNSVTSIGACAFDGCTSLTSVHISDLTAWCNIPFSDPSSNPLTYAQHLYLNGKEVTDLVIPNDVNNVSDYAFLDCFGLTSVTIPNSVTSIGEDAFFNCSGLKSVTIGSGVTSIGESAFSCCSGLKSVTIGCGVTGIGQLTFSYCESLTSVTIPNSVTSIGESAFSCCSGLKSVTIGSGVTSISQYAFSYCESLTSVTIPNSVTSIGACAFYYCESLTSVTIPNSVTSIDSYAFSSCSGLTDVYCLADNVPQSPTSYYDNPFYDSSINSTTLHVPETSLEIYKTTFPWNSFGTIVGLTDEDAIAEVKTDVVTEMECYDIQGRKLDKPQKGINIIRYSDGTSKKVLVK